jgi:gas vesicle protein
MGQDPAAIREQIEHTRDQIGETVDALGYKADVPARAKDAVSERLDTAKDAVSERFGMLKSKAGGVGTQVSDAAPDPGEVADGARRAAGVAQENPLGLAVGAAAVGFLAGMLIPGTKLEDERIGPMADQVKEQARATGEEALDHGRQIAQETAQSVGQKAQEAVAEVKDEVQENAQEHAGQLADSARQSAEHLQPSDV